MEKQTKKQIKKIIYFLLKWGSLFFILKLFLWSFKFKFGGGGFIDLSIGPTGYEFSWHWNNTIAVILFVIWTTIIFLIKKRIIKIFFLLVVLLLGIFGKELVYGVSPKFQFYFTHRYESEVYKNGVFDVDKYIEYVRNYCVNDRYWSFLGEGELGWCYGKGKIGVELGTSEDVIKLLEFSKEENSSFLYSRFFTSINQIGFDDVIKKYKDKTFQAYVVRKNRSDKDLLTKLKEEVVDTNLVNIINMLNNRLKYYYDNKSNYSNDESYEYWDDILFELKKQIRNLDGINQSLFY